jgi:hypothetical protein
MAAGWSDPDTFSRSLSELHKAEVAAQEAIEKAARTTAELETTRTNESYLAWVIHTIHAHIAKRLKKDPTDEFLKGVVKSLTASKTNFLAGCMDKRARELVASELRSDVMGDTNGTGP